MKYGRSDLVKKAGLEEVVATRAGGAPSEDEAAPSSWPPTSRRWGRRSSSSASSSPRAPTSSPSPTWRRWPACRTRWGRSRSWRSRRIVSAELGVRLSKAFSEFEQEPVAAASLGQVHRAALRDGRRVAVKVQRPDIREQIVKDLEALREIAAFADQHTEWPAGASGSRPMLDEFRKTLLARARLPAWRRATWRSCPRTCARSTASSCPCPSADYTHLARAHHRLHPGREDHQAQPARAHGVRRRGAGRAALPRLPAADPGRRLRARGSASRQRLPDRRQPRRAPRPRHGGARSRRACRRSCCACCWR